MALYQHSARCPSALKWFVDENPAYAPFVPTQQSDALIDDDDEELTEWTADVPPPPANARFTREQKLQMDRFFRERHYLNPINAHLDLYQAAIVAIRNACSVLDSITRYSLQVPIDASEALRRTIEALFIAHAETRLNTDGHFF